MTSYFANQIKQKRASLKETTTVIKNIPTVMTNDTHTFNNQAQHQQRPNFLSNENLANIKNILKPTITKVTTAHAFTTDVIIPKTKIPKTTKRLQVENTYYEAHGHRGNKNWIYPKMITECDADARPGYSSRKAHEYVDELPVLQEKVKELAKMIIESKHFLIYTGAGISTSSGIDDYASVGTNSYIKQQKKHEALAKPRSPLLAQPTFAHRALAQLHDQYYSNKDIKREMRWIQQNHDGLPQKAGFPQEKLNEIHGAWFDPSNPVVPMSGSLRTDLFNDLLEWEKKCDLVLSMGTSMCGMNADRVFTTCSTKALKQNPGAIGGVIINLQCTQFDHLSALRIFAPIDLVMKMLLEELKTPVPAATIQSNSINGKEWLQSLNVVYGNTYRHVQNNANPQNEHAWCGFIRFENRDGEQLVGHKCSDFIDEILFNMQNYFPPASVLKPSKLGNYQTPEYLGWGTFNIEITIRFKKHFNLNPVKFVHYLTFLPSQPYGIKSVVASSTKSKLLKMDENNENMAENKDVFYIPYNSQGKLMDGDINQMQILDLREGASVKLTCGPYKGDIGEVTGKNRDGHYKIRFLHRLKPNKPLRMPFERLLGNWWVKTLSKGAVAVSPIIQTAV
jgi:NAD-dependent SIR2 family protein deacetylase